MPLSLAYAHMHQADIETEEEQEARTPLADVREDDELWGEITKVSNYGAFVDVGVEVQGFLHIIYYPRRAQVGLSVDWRCLCLYLLTIYFFSADLPC